MYAHTHTHTFIFINIDNYSELLHTNNFITHSHENEVTGTSHNLGRKLGSCNFDIENIGFRPSSALPLALEMK